MSMTVTVALVKNDKASSGLYRGCIVSVSENENLYIPSYLVTMELPKKIEFCYQSLSKQSLGAVTLMQFAFKVLFRCCPVTDRLIGLELCISF